MKKGPKIKGFEISKKELKIYEKLGLDMGHKVGKPSNYNILMHLLEEHGLTIDEIEAIVTPQYVPGNLYSSPEYYIFQAEVLSIPSGSILVADCLWSIGVRDVGELIGWEPNVLVTTIISAGWSDKPGATAALEITLSFVLLVQFHNLNKANMDPWPWWPPGQP